MSHYSRSAFHERRSGLIPAGTIRCTYARCQAWLAVRCVPRNGGARGSPAPLSPAVASCRCHGDQPPLSERGGPASPFRLDVALSISSSPRLPPLSGCQSGGEWRRFVLGGGVPAWPGSSGHYSSRCRPSSRRVPPRVTKRPPEAHALGEGASCCPEFTNTPQQRPLAAVRRPRRGRSGRARLGGAGDKAAPQAWHRRSTHGLGGAPRHVKS